MSSGVNVMQENYEVWWQCLSSFSSCI